MLSIISATRVFGIICLFASCDYIFPPPKTPKLVNLPLESNSALIVNTNCGKVEGYYANSLNGKLFRAFEGIPFAQPPIGKFRFQEPQRKTKWTGILKANRKITCIQMDPLRYYNVIGQEDCLYLNIYVPENRGLVEKLPVLLFLHGGSFYWGAGHLTGPAYFMDQDVILISTNYRLGVLGFLSTGDEASYGNWGLKDQALALDWTIENIENFGGDPTRITLSGHSAGGASTHLQMMSLRSKGKFNSAISISASALAHWALPPNQLELTKRLAKNVGCQFRENIRVVDCLRKRRAKRLVSNQYSLFEWLENPPILFGPILEPNHTNSFISKSPEELYAEGQVANIPFYTGVTKDEGDLFALVNYLALGTRRLLKQINSSLPRILQYDKTNKNLTKEIQSFYLSRFQRGVSLSAYEALRCLSAMVGDRFFYVPFHKTLRLHSELVQAPLYGYLFTYKGRHGVTEKFHVSPNDWGVMHMDDMQYVFNTSEFYPPIQNTDREFIISDYVIKLWTSFIQTGVPLISSNTERLTTNEWIPYGQNGQTQLLEINFDSKMRDEVYTDRVEFWKSINLY